VPAKQFCGHILIAEDSGAIQLLIGLLVEQMGMSYQVVDNGQAAVDIMHAESFDLVLMDLQMPVLSGIDATAAIRQFDSSTPIVALSSDVLLYDKDADRLAGFSDLLPKPVEMGKLQKTFEKMLPAQEQFASQQKDRIFAGSNSSAISRSSVTSEKI
jgi:CheY-like chemotaxis protein